MEKDSSGRQLIKKGELHQSYVKQSITQRTNVFKHISLQENVNENKSIMGQSQFSSSEVNIRAVALPIIPLDLCYSSGLSSKPNHS